MCFIDNSFFIRNFAKIFFFPRVFFCVNYHRFRNIWCTVQIAERQVLFRAVNIISEYCFVPSQFADNFFCIGVKKKFVRVKTLAFFRSIRTIYTITVNLSGKQLRNINMPNIIVVLSYNISSNFFLSFFIKKAQFNFFGSGRKKGKIYTFSVIGCAKRIRGSDLSFYVFHAILRWFYILPLRFDNNGRKRRQSYLY